MIAFDANVLVYAVDGAAGTRHARAVSVLARALAHDEVLLPLQVLGEFYNVATKKLLLPSDQIRGFVEDWVAVAHVEPYQYIDFDIAINARDEHGLPFWDALIWAVCERVGVRILASEDFQNGRRLGRVTFLDPFDPANAARLGLG